MKAAVANLTQSLALELGGRMIRVNCVAPDVIPTPGIGDVPVRTPLPRAGHVDDVAGAVVFLANPKLSGFVTGSTIHVDGGNRAAAGWHRQPDGDYLDVKFGVALGGLNPHFHLDTVDAAERLGYESVWLPEHLVFPVEMTRSPRPARITRRCRRPHRSSTRSPTWRSSPLGTERVRVGTHVYNVGLRHPFISARAVATLDRLSGGRFEYGVGAGWLEQEWIAAGLDFASRGRRVDETRDFAAALDRSDDRTPRRVLRFRCRGIRTQAVAVALAADPRRW